MGYLHRNIQKDNIQNNMRELLIIMVLLGLTFLTIEVHGSSWSYGVKILTRNTSIVNGICYASTIDLGTTRAYGELGSVKSLLVNKLPYSPIYANIADKISGSFSQTPARITLILEFRCPAQKPSIVLSYMLTLAMHSLRQVSKHMFKTMDVIKAFKELEKIRNVPILRI